MPVFTRHDKRLAAIQCKADTKNDTDYIVECDHKIIGSIVKQNNGLFQYYPARKFRNCDGVSHNTVQECLDYIAK